VGGRLSPPMQLYNRRQACFLQYFLILCDGSVGCSKAKFGRWNKNPYFLRLLVFTVDQLLWLQLCKIKKNIHELYNISLLVDRYKTQGLGGKLTEEQLT